MAALLASIHPVPGDAAPSIFGRAAVRVFQSWPGRVVPGLLLCIGVTLSAIGLERIEARLAGAAWLEALVLAILVGTAIRTTWTPGHRWTAGIDFSAKFLLEVAVVLLGASLSARTVLAAGPGLAARHRGCGCAGHRLAPTASGGCWACRTAWRR